MTGQVRGTQRVEAGATALVVLVVAGVLYPECWWVVPAAFLAFDLSMLGYLRSSAAGATTYNLVHNYAAPAGIAAVAFAMETASPTTSTVAGIVACAWAFHVAVDRALGYGLKLPDSFRNTHLGWMGDEGSFRGHCVSGARDHAVAE